MTIHHYIFIHKSFPGESVKGLHHKNLCKLPWEPLLPKHSLAALQQRHETTAAVGTAPGPELLLPSSKINSSGSTEANLRQILLISTSFLSIKKKKKKQHKNGAW